MRPILMKGHERPLTFLKYNREGDLLFSCAKDHNPTVWFADNGERLGTYRGHNGAVWCCDVSRDSMQLITASADQSVKLWNVQTGAQLYTFSFNSPARSVDFSVGDKLAVITTDPFMGVTSAINVKRIADDPSQQSGESELTITGPAGRINRAVWGPLNRTIISAGEDCVVRIWDSETGKLLKESEPEVGHKKPISSLTKSADGSHFLTGSLDKSAKLWDSRTLTLIKNYTTERPVNAVAMSPLLDHVVLGGGQDASSVTTTDHRAGKFEAKFYDKILQEEIGGVKGHFGPINALAFNPDGKRSKGHSFQRCSSSAKANDVYFSSYPAMMTVANSNDSLNLGEWEEQSCKDIAGQPLESTIDFSSCRNDFNNLCRHQTNSDYNSMLQKTDSPSLALPLPSSSTF
ncbi:hypothetical protein D5086_016684 [Populus alba]|uniref:Uncharacterized protein n=1 Tax=Populus alba TaxID=43335 RepID=A0ACC4BW23_POPAL